MRLVAREALLAFRRTPLLSLLSIATIGFSLFTIGLYALVALNFRDALESLAERVEIVAFVMRGTPAESITLAADDIAAFPEVESVSFVSEDQALERAQAELDEFREAFKDLATNPLPASLEIQMKPPFRSGEAVKRVADRLAGYSFIEDVRYGRDWVQRLDRIRRLATVVQLLIGAAFAIVAIAIIGVTIRITVFQRANEIAIMRLVGATNGFIRGPFVLEGAIKGLLGGLLALGLCAASFATFRAGLGADLPDLRFFDPGMIFLILLFGMLLGLLGSMLSVGRHLRHV
ncbi:MAG: permease-like cell division protein FtsX [Gemmatimonadota bacterium]|jgi:cell division transport system permease protein|nr:permease-like cell division protein FtsX [Gemmatimonadota bacterium]